MGEQMLRKIEEVYWPDPGTGEVEIRLLDEKVFGNSPWLREKRFWGSYTKLIERFAKLKIIAVSIGSDGARPRGRMWFLRKTDSFDLPCPIEAVIPTTVTPNGQSTPYFTVHGQNSL
jgi:hypothetical protein